MRMSKSALPELGVGPWTGPPAPTIKLTWITDEANLSIQDYKTSTLIIDDHIDRSSHKLI